MHCALRRERQLVSILSAWAMDTDILLLDEPTANLDYAAIKELGDLLGKLKDGQICENWRN